MQLTVHGWGGGAEADGEWEAKPVARQTKVRTVLFGPRSRYVLDDLKNRPFVGFVPIFLDDVIQEHYNFDS